MSTSIVEQWGKTVKEAVKMFGSNLSHDAKQDYEQECFIKILETETEIERILAEQGQAPATTYVFVMCKNKILNLTRDNRKQTVLVSLWDSDVQKEVGRVPAFSDLGTNEEQLDEAVKQLPASEQHIIRSLFFHDQTEQDVAKTLGKTRHFVRQIKDSAIQQLRVILESK